MALIPDIAELQQQRPVTYKTELSLLQLQQNFVDLRFGMFIHFNMATFQDREWGDPTSPATLFNPTALDTDQWAQAAKDAKMTWGCLTTKHHDGFPIWPTKTGVAHSSVDVVRAYVDSFRKAGLRTALYFSILDLRQDIRHFNITPKKIQLIKDQLTELLTNYGPIDILIIDGWDAPWSRITYEEVPFHEIYALIKELQPNCLISDLNASQYPEGGLYYTDVKAFEQNAGQHLPDESDIPAYSCVTLTDGWFWKQSDIDGPLKSVDQVVNQWLIPQNERHCNLILNAAPTREGQLAPNVVERLKEIGTAWTKPQEAMSPLKPSIVITTRNLATGRPIHASSNPDTVGPDLANDGKFSSSWYPDFGKLDGSLTIELEPNTLLNTFALVEPIGSFDDYKETRLKDYVLEVNDGLTWKTVVSAQDAKAVRMHRFETVKTNQVRLRFNAHRDTPHIAEIGLYNEPR